MSEHIERVGHNYSGLNVLILGLLVCLGFYIYNVPRTAYVETTPKIAQIYLGDNLICDYSPCEINLPIWPTRLSILADNYSPQEIYVLNLNPFTQGQQTYKIDLSPYVTSPPKINITPEAKKAEVPNVGTLPRDDKPPKISEGPPKKTVKSKPTAPTPKSDKPSAPYIKAPFKLTESESPLACLETKLERKHALSREPILCHYEDDKRVTSDKSGTCYANYTVLKNGYVKDTHDIGCMHAELMEPARQAFASGVYLPALANGRPIQSVVFGEIIYGRGSERADINPALNYKRKRERFEDQLSKRTVNRDARVLSCPPPDKPKQMSRSGHCIFEFDLTKDGIIAQIRQTQCTDASLKNVTLKSLNKCKFRPAVSDNIAVRRDYMKHQIDLNLYDKKGRKIPPHASFGHKVVNKPYIVFE